MMETTILSDTETIISSAASDTEIINQLLKHAGNALTFKCKFTGCGLEFPRKDAYDRHEHTHTGIKKYQCFHPNCTKFYSNNAHLRRHNRTAHSLIKKEKDSENVPCDFQSCPRVFAKRSNMRNHYKQKHLLVKNQCCTQCDAKFYRKAQLKKHVFEHTNEYPYKCDECTKGFLTLKLYQRHISATHKTYKCNDCNDLTFDKWSQVLAHRQKMHQPTCEICHKQFSNVTNKRTHMKTHLNVEDKPALWCPHKPCARFYSNRQSLQVHIRHKHENKKVQCDYCQQMLSTKQKLTKHMLKYHVNGNCLVPTKGRRGTRKEKEPSNREGRYFFQKISTAAILTGLRTSARIEKLVVNDRGKDIQLHEECDEEDDNEVNIVAVLPDGSELSSAEN